MVRIVLRWVDSPWAFELLPGLNRLGRNPTNDFRISDPSVSSFHAELFVEPGEIRVVDLRSTNGTFIDETKVEEGTLRPENVLRLGHVQFRLEEHPVAQAASHGNTSPAVEIAPSCVYHPDVRAAYKCENCGAAVCRNCLTVVGQGKFEETTICPVCQGQCYPLASAHSAADETHPSLFHRLTRTLRIPFSSKENQENQEQND